MSKAITPFTGDFCQLPLMLTADDIASVLRVSRAYAYEILHDASLPVIVLGKRRMVHKEQFKTWLDTRLQKGEA